MAFDENGNLIEDTETPPVEAPDAEAGGTVGAPSSRIGEAYRGWRASVAEKFKNPAAAGAQQPDNFVITAEAQAKEEQDKEVAATDKKVVFLKGQGGMVPNEPDYMGQAAAEAKGQFGRVVAPTLALSVEETAKAIEARNKTLAQLISYYESIYNMNPAEARRMLMADAKTYMEKPGVSRGALDSLIAQGAPQMEGPDTPDIKSKLIMKAALGMTAKLFGNIGSLAVGGGVSQQSGMMVDAGTKILSRTGQMLMADVEKYQVEKKRIGEINFALLQKYNGDVLQMQADFENRSDANERAYMGAIQAAAENEYQFARGTYMKGVESIESAKVTLGQAKDATKNQMNTVNTQMEFQARTTNAQLEASKKNWILNRAQLRLQQDAERMKNSGLDQVVQGMTKGFLTASVKYPSTGGQLKSADISYQAVNGLREMTQLGTKGRIEYAQAEARVKSRTEVMDSMGLSGEEQLKVNAVYAAYAKNYPEAMTREEFEEFANKVVQSNVMVGGVSPVAGSPDTVATSLDLIEPYIRGSVKQGIVKKQKNSMGEDEFVPSENWGSYNAQANGRIAVVSAGLWFQDFAFREVPTGKTKDMSPAESTVAKQTFRVKE